MIKLDEVCPFCGKKKVFLFNLSVYQSTHKYQFIKCRSCLSIIRKTYNFERSQVENGVLKKVYYDSDV